MPTFATPTAIGIDVSIGVGDVHVISSDRTDTVVAVRPHDPHRDRDARAAEQAQIELVNDRLTVRVERGTSGAWLRNLRTQKPPVVEVTVEAPTGSALDVDTQMGHIRADGQFANTRLHTGTGDIRADGSFGHVNARTGTGNIQLARAEHADLKSGAGDIEVARTTGPTHVATAGAVIIERTDGPTTVRNASGPIRIEDARGPVRANSSASDVALTRTTDDVVAKSASGSVTIDEIVSGNVVLRTAAGNVRAGIAQGTAVHLDMATGFGRVVNGLTPTDAPVPTAATASLQARTSAGDIEVHRAVNSHSEARS